MIVPIAEAIITRIVISVTGYVTATVIPFSTIITITHTLTIPTGITVAGTVHGIITGAGTAVTIRITMAAPSSLKIREITDRRVVQ